MEECFCSNSDTSASTSCKMRTNVSPRERGYDAPAEQFRYLYSSKVERERELPVGRFGLRTALGRSRSIKTKVTELGGCAEVINEQASQLREEIKEALVCIEESTRSARKEKPTLGSVVLMDKTAASH
jgi:hypothetical protein